MPTIEALCERPKPIAPTMSGSEVFARFRSEPDTLVIPVVDNDRPIGLVERTTFLEKIAGPFGHGLYEGRAVTFVMDAEPAVVEAGVRIDAFCDIMLKGGPAALLRGFIVTRNGLEGGAIYALASVIRDALERGEAATLVIDLAPDMTVEEIARRVAQGREKDSRANTLRKQLSLSPAALAILRESEGGPLPADLLALAARVKHASLPITGVAGLERAISTAGGVSADALDEHLMLRALPGTFVAGEMLDWDAPTGGYLLTACFATGRAAGQGVAQFLALSKKLMQCT